MRIQLAIACAVTGIIGCSEAGPTTTTSETRPTLEITAPQRGTFATGETVTVTGRVVDDGPVRLSVNGLDVVPEADGTFTTAVRVRAGIAIFETHAIDADDHDVDDVRAVLVGTQAPTDGSLAAPVGAHAGTTGLTQIGHVIETAAEAINFTAAAQGLNPVYNNTGCLGARIDITSIGLSNIGVALAPKTNALSTDVAIDNVVVRLHAAFKVACIGGSTDITVRSTKARVHGDLGVNLTTGKIATSIAGVTVALDGFSIDVGGVPGAIEDLLKTQARDAVIDALTTVIRDRVPPIADQALAKLVAAPFDASLFGHDTKITVAAKQVTLAPSGLFVAVATTVRVDGGEGGTFVSTPVPLLASSMQGQKGFGLAIADDVANQLFAGLWAAGALDLQLPIDAVGPLAAILDDDARTVEIKLGLPPMMTTDTIAQLSVGELTVTTRDAAGAEVQRISVSLRTTLAAEPASPGKLALTLGKPEVHAQLIVQSDAVEFPLTSAQLEGIVDGVWGLVGSMASDALAKLPMPSLAGLQLGAPTIEGRDGYLVADLAP